MNLNFSFTFDQIHIHTPNHKRHIQKNKNILPPLSLSCLPVSQRNNNNFFFRCLPHMFKPFILKTSNHQSYQIFTHRKWLLLCYCAVVIITQTVFLMRRTEIKESFQFVFRVGFRIIIHLFGFHLLLVVSLTYHHAYTFEVEN